MLFIYLVWKTCYLCIYFFIKNKNTILFTEIYLLTTCSGKKKKISLKAHASPSTKKRKAVIERDQTHVGIDV